MFIQEYLNRHYILLVELSGLWAMLSVGVHINPKTVKYTRIIIFLILLESILWTWELLTQTLETCSLLRHLLTATIYVLHPITLIGIINMIEPDKKLFTNRVIIPLVLYIVIMYSSQWTHFVYWFDENNKMMTNGIMRYLPYGLIIYYTFLFIINFRSYFSKYNLSLQRSIIYIVVTSAIGVFTRVTLKTETDYSTLFASAVVLYYLFLYIYKSRVDTLTELWNRQCFYHDINRHLKDLSAIVVTDMNELKYTNDTFGHKYGDAAIICVVNALIKDQKPFKEGYRVGGDEFMFLYFNVDEQTVIEDINLMRNNLSETEYTCAFGYAMLDESHNYELAMQQADRSMYANKTAIKKAILEAGGQLHRRADDFQ